MCSVPLDFMMKFIKTTLIGGVLFLVPVAILVMVLGNVMDVMQAVAEPMSDLIPMETIAGVATANIIAAIIILFVCFVAGLIARTKSAQRVAGKLESSLLNRIPGYAMVKGFADTLSPTNNAELKSVLVRFEDSSRLGLEVERSENDEVTVYFPGSPNAWAGIVQIVSAAQVKSVDAPMTSIIEQAELLGRGTKNLVGTGEQEQQGEKQ